MKDFMRSLAEDILTAMGPGGRFLGVDGVDGSGKTTFAAKLAAAIPDRAVIVIHLDNFLNPSAIRHAKGRDSAKGFWQDTYNYAALRDQVFAPLQATGNRWYAPSSYDHQADRTAPSEFIQAPSDALILVEGMFLHRDELYSCWDASVFLDVPFTETAARMAVRNGSNPDPEHPTMLRYVGGQRRYFAAVQPRDRATFVIDNTDFTSPKVIRPNMVAQPETDPVG